LSGVLTLALALLAGSTQIAAAQNAVSSADIQRLQDSIYDASRDVEQARARNSAAAAQLQQDLDEARDEVIYLRVKLRKNEAIARSEYSSLRERIEDIRTRARGDGNVRSAPSATVPDEDDRRPGRAGTLSGEDVPVGTELDVRLQTALSSKTAQVEDRFEATTMVELSEGDRVLIPAGSVLRGVVSSVNKAGRIERQGKLTLAFDQITVKGRSYPIRATVTQALESEGIRGEAGRIGAGAGVGAIIGGILGGLKGALTGILIGAGGTIAATEGTDVELPAGTVLRVRLDTPLDLR
jgi:TolA-binding protein